MIYAMDLKNLLFSAHIFEVGENNDIGSWGWRLKSWLYWFYNGHFIAVGLYFFHTILKQYLES